MRTFTLLLTVMIASVVTANAQTTYTADKAHAYIGFTIDHLVISKVKGQFKDYTATLELDENNNLLESAALIKVASIDTGIDKRDEHLRSADFFDVAQFPEMSFESRTVTEQDGKKVIVGDLIIRGVAKEITLPYEIKGPIQDPSGNTKIGFQAGTTINRADFGLTWNRAIEAGGVVVGEEVELVIDMEFQKQ